MRISVEERNVTNESSELQSVTAHLYKLVFAAITVNKCPRELLLQL